MDIYLCSDLSDSFFLTYFLSFSIFLRAFRTADLVNGRKNSDQDWKKKETKKKPNLAYSALLIPYT